MGSAAQAIADQPVVVRDQQFVVRNYGRYPLVVDRAEGVYLIAPDGRRYLDFMSGIGVMALGHAHPRIVAAVHDQIQTLAHCSNLYYHPLQGAVAERLSQLSGLQRTFFCNSGSESVEAALKIVKGHGRAIDPEKTEIVALEGSFGGRTLGSISVTGQPKYSEPFSPLIPGIRFVPPNDCDALETAVGDRTAGIIFEPILGEGGIVSITKEFAWKIRDLANAHNALVICDEIQSGLGRTGEHFAFNHFGPEFKPDIITLAKPMASGLPIGATVCTDAAAEVLAPGMHGSTFGGGGLACRAAMEFLDMLPDLMVNVRKASENLRARLGEFANQYDFVTGLRGRGLMVGIELSVPGGELVPRAQEAGLLINCTAGNVLRMLPPFIIESTHVDEAVEIMAGVLRDGPSGSSA